MKELFAQLDDIASFYDNGTVQIADDITFGMPKVVKQITHYILSRYMDGGANDNLDPQTQKRRPFQNIGNAIVDLEWRAKNIDRKSIEGQSKDGDYLFELVVNKELQQWMQDNNFGKTIDDYQRKKSEYGSVLLKKTETADELIIEPVQWGTMKVDPRDITNGPKINQHFLTPLQLKKKADVWDEGYDGESAIDAVLRLHKADKTKSENRIELWDVEAEFEDKLVYPEDDNEDETIGLYNVIVAIVGKKKVCLYREKLTESRYKHDKRKEVEGRDFGIGVWEEVFEPQIWTNEAVIAEKEAMDLSGKVVITTNKKGLPSALELVNGETIELEANEFFKSEPLLPGALPEFGVQIDRWFQNTQRDQSAYPGVTGEEPKASTPGISLQLQAAQGGSIFNKRRDQDGFFMLEVIMDWVLPFIVKKIQREHQLTASYSPAELKKLDALIVADHTHRKSKDSILGANVSADLGQPIFPQGIPSPLQFAADKQAELDPQGDTRSLFIPKGFITMKKIREKLRLDITDEMSDSQRRINTLAVALSNLPPGDPARVPLVQEMMELGGVSAATFSITGAASSAPVKPVDNTPTAVNSVLPAGQQK